MNLSVPLPTPAQLAMMHTNFTNRAEQFERLAEKDPAFAKGAVTFRWLASECQPVVNEIRPAVEGTDGQGNGARRAWAEAPLGGPVPAPKEQSAP